MYANKPQMAKQWEKEAVAAEVSVETEPVTFAPTNNWQSGGRSVSDVKEAATANVPDGADDLPF